MSPENVQPVLLFEWRFFFLVHEYTKVSNSRFASWSIPLHPYSLPTVLVTLPNALCVSPSIVPSLLLYEFLLSSICCSNSITLATTYKITALCALLTLSKTSLCAFSSILLHRSLLSTLCYNRAPYIMIYGTLLFSLNAPPTFGNIVANAAILFRDTSTMWGPNGTLLVAYDSRIPNLFCCSYWCPFYLRDNFSGRVMCIGATHLSSLLLNKHHHCFLPVTRFIKHFQQHFWWSLHSYFYRFLND